MRARALLLQMQRICSKTRPAPVRQAGGRRDTFAVPSISPLPNQRNHLTPLFCLVFFIDFIAAETAK
jgi:hypothetical protein